MEAKAAIMQATQATQAKRCEDAAGEMRDGFDQVSSIIDAASGLWLVLWLQTAG
jgi:hypothetical protein